MELIFSKDECAPDAETIEEYKQKHQIEISRDGISIACEYRDTLKHYFAGEDNKYYVEVFSCGVFEDLYLFFDRKEFESNLLFAVNETVFSLEMEKLRSFYQNAN